MSSWIDQNRRMSTKDYERLTETSEAFIYMTMSRLVARLFGQFLNDIPGNLRG